jgi:hypothetical protein
MDHTPPRRSSSAALIYLLVVFASGAVVGGFAVRLYLAKTVSASRLSAPPPTHAEIRRQYLHDMQDRLHLSDAQMTQLQQIVDDTGKQMQEVHQMRQRIDDEHARRVMAMLDDSQKAEYAKMRAERDKHRQEQAKK